MKLQRSVVVRVVAKVTVSFQRVNDFLNHADLEEDMDADVSDGLFSVCLCAAFNITLFVYSATSILTAYEICNVFSH